MVPRAVLMKTSLKAVNTARPVTTAHPKITVYRMNLMEDMLPLGKEPKEGKLLVKDLLKLLMKVRFYLKFLERTICTVLIVPKESLTCLVEKATLDESMLWHRRLGHVNFKTTNKLVKENLVR
ncbi:putative ribonuclease H-like domain-containing protein, partial [Tanacetum coccineum]